MDSSALSRRREVLPQRGHGPRAHHRGSSPDRRRVPRATGVHERHHGPLSGHLKTGLFAGKRPKGSGIRALWGQRWARLPFFLSRHGKYCHKGAWPSPHNVAATEIADGVRAGRGSWNSVMEQRHGPPLRTPRNGDLQARTAKGPRSSPLGAAIRSSGSPTNGSSAWSAKRDRTGREVLVARIERGC
jgi:hypothetical protein